jgi:sortase A
MMRRYSRPFGTLRIVAGVATLAWAFVVWAWQDPFTNIYTRYEQHQLAQRYERLAASYRPRVPAGTSLVAAKRELRNEARRYRAAAHRGAAIGRISVPRMGIEMVLVNGTDHDTLTKGPGRDARSAMPGEGKLVYIAGHRTTYLAPFSHIDHLRNGDRVTLTMPYATFVYSISGHRIVTADDLSVLKSHGYEQLALQACHPRFFASHRYIAYAKLVSVQMRGAPAGVSATALAAAAQS